MRTSADMEKGLCCDVQKLVKKLSSKIKGRIKAALGLAQSSAEEVAAKAAESTKIDMCDFKDDVRGQVTSSMAEAMLEVPPTSEASIHEDARLAARSILSERFYGMLEGQLHPKLQSTRDFLEVQGITAIIKGTSDDAPTKRLGSVEAYKPYIRAIAEQAICRYQDGSAR